MNEQSLSWISPSTMHGLVPGLVPLGDRNEKLLPTVTVLRKGWPPLPPMTILGSPIESANDNPASTRTQAANCSKRRICIVPSLGTELIDYREHANVGPLRTRPQASLSSLNLPICRFPPPSPPVYRVHCAIHFS